MMEIGWCGPLSDAVLMREVGLDFIEVPLAPLGLEGRESFAAAKEAVAVAPLPTAAFNTFLPRDMRVVGPDADIPRFRAYLDRAADLMAGAGAKVVVFGSGWARNVPDGFERAKGEAQMLDALNLAADALRGTGTVLVIEPLNRSESNLINSVREGARFAREVDRPEVRVLADFYHMDEEDEPLDTLEAHATWLAHVHLADTGRMNPGTGSYDYPAFAAHLGAAGYTGMISAECGVADKAAGMRDSLAFLRRLWPDSRGAAA
jgi:sugar phosphate isomerase/epimerase